MPVELKETHQPLLSTRSISRGNSRIHHALSRRFRDCPFRLQLSYPNGTTQTLGTGTTRVHVVLKHARAVSAVLSMDEGQIAETYMDGSLVIDGDMLSALSLRARLHDRNLLANLWRFVQPYVFGQVGTNSRAIRHHYDLGPEFYQSVMDSEVPCYTQGIFEHDDEPLATATRRKFDTCINTCNLQPGRHVLEVGPGWGAFSSYAYERGIRVTGVMNSPDSKTYMDELGQRLGYQWRMILDDIMHFDSQDRFDAIVLMGVMEHLPNYRAVLEKFSRLLKPGGYVYLDASASRQKYVVTSFIYRHIFPGNHSFFVLHDFLAALARTPLHLHSLHCDRHNYFLTFKQ